MVVSQNLVLFRTTESIPSRYKDYELVEMDAARRNKLSLTCRDHTSLASRLDLLGYQQE
jgi:hypothetical protein